LFSQGEVNLGTPLNKWNFVIPAKAGIHVGDATRAEAGR